MERVAKALETGAAQCRYGIGPIAGQHRPWRRLLGGLALTGSGQLGHSTTRAIDLDQPNRKPEQGIQPQTSKK